jgi:hypothetical protein
MIAVASVNPGVTPDAGAKTKCKRRDTMTDDNPKTWLDKIVQPTEISERVTARPGQITIPPPHPQFERIKEIERLCAAGKFASAARLFKLHRKLNPWINN